MHAEASERPLITVMVPTIGRHTLLRTLRSINLQGLHNGVEVVIVGDEYEGLTVLPFAADCVRDSRFPARYVGTNTGRHDFSHSNRKAALPFCSGEWLVTVDDDDILAPLALIALTDAISAQPEPRPLMMKMDTWWGERLWDLPRLEKGRMGSGNFVPPLIEGKVGTWGSSYEGDFDFITSTLAFYDGEPDWSDALLTICRPSQSADWTLQ